jgi:hypothetical protein
VANYTEDSVIETVGGPGPFEFDLPLDAGSKVFAGSLVTQLTATGFLVPYSTASAGHVVGVAQHGADLTAAGTADGDARVRVTTKRMFAFANGTAGDAFADTDKIGSVVYGTDDHTVAKTSNTQARKPVGFFYGFESDGKVRVYVDPAMAFIASVLSSLADSPATADALRDALVAALG